MKISFIDLFCGIGGFHYGIKQAARRNGLSVECAFASDIDDECRKAYSTNFGKTPVGDIKQVLASEIPDHDLLLAGFPCQPFSIIGNMRGFADTRGTLFFEIARILEAKRPSAFILENVKLLAGHNQGQTLSRILETIQKLGYFADHCVLNALHFGLPQKRERIFIVGFRDREAFTRFEWCKGKAKMKPLVKILEPNVPKKYFASERIKASRWSRLQPTAEPTIWHENKAGHISAYPYSCALRAGASYNYLLVNGERRLTPREMLRLQGFPNSFKIICNDWQTRKQAGNSVPVNLVEAVANQVIRAQNWQAPLAVNGNHENKKGVSPEPNGHPYGRTKTSNGRKISTTLSNKRIPDLVRR